MGYEPSEEIDALICLYVGTTRRFRRKLEIKRISSESFGMKKAFQGALSYITRNGEAGSFSRIAGESHPTRTSTLAVQDLLMEAALQCEGSIYTPFVKFSKLVYVEWMCNILKHIKGTDQEEFTWDDIIKRLPEEFVEYSPTLTADSLIQSLLEYDEENHEGVSILKDRILRDNFHVLNEKFVVQDKPVDAELLNWITGPLLTVYYVQWLAIHTPKIKRISPILSVRLDKPARLAMSEVYRSIIVTPFK